MTNQVPERFYINLDRDIIYFSQRKPIIGRYKFLEYFEKKMMTMPKTVAFDLCYTRNGKEEGRYPLFALCVEVLRVAETLILVLPTDIEGGEWKERRFAAPQRGRVVWNMTQSEQDVLINGYIYWIGTCTTQGPTFRSSRLRRWLKVGRYIKGSNTGLDHTINAHAEITPSSLS